MERSLLWSAFAIGWAGWLYGLFVTRPRRSGAPSLLSGLPRLFLFTAIALPILVFLITLPQRPPFAAGHGFGNGFLLGGFGALLAGWVLARAFVSLDASSDSALQTPCAAAAVASPYALSLVTVTIPLLWMRTVLPDALLGVAIGWFCVIMVLYLAPPALTPDPSSNLRENRGWGLGSLGFTILLCAVAALGEYRTPFLDTAAAQPVSWSALAVAYAAGVPLFMLLTALPTSVLGGLALKLPIAPLVVRLASGIVQTEESRQTAGRGARGLLCLLLLLGLGKLLARKVHGEPQLFLLLGLGLLVGLVAWWVVAARRRQERESPETALVSGRQNGALAVLVVLAGIMAAYQMLAGMGIGLLLIGAWMAASLALMGALENPDAEAVPQPVQTPIHLLRLLAFGLIVLLYRLCASRFTSDLHGVTLTDEFALFGFLVGAVLPGLLSGFLLRLAPGSAGSRLLRLIVSGAITLIAPALLLILLGARSELALLMGLALAAALPEMIPEPETETSISNAQRPTPNAQSLLPVLFALAIALALAQWTHHVLPLALISRREKIHLLAWVIGALIALILLADYGGRIQGWWQRRRSGSISPAPAEGAVR